MYRLDSLAKSSSMDEITAIAHVLRPRKYDANTSELKNERIVASVISVCFALVLGFLAWAFIFFRRRRQARRGDSEQPQQYHNDFNAEPLFSHRPLQTLSDSTFSIDAGPSQSDNRSQHPQTSAPHLPQLPDLGDSSLKFEPLQHPINATPGTSSSSTSNENDAISSTLQTAFSDPFSDSAAISRFTSEATPSVSPSTYPLRDRLNRDAIRRRRAIENVARNDSQRGRERMSIGEQEMRDLLAAFEKVEEQMDRERGGRSRSVEDAGRR